MIKQFNKPIGKFTHFEPKKMYENESNESIDGDIIIISINENGEELEEKREYGVNIEKPYPFDISSEELESLIPIKKEENGIIS